MGGHVLAVVKKRQNERKKIDFHKTNLGASAAKWFQEALISKNEESDNEEYSGLALGSRTLVTFLSSTFFAPINFLSY